MVNRWTRGNRVELLVNGEAFFPRVFGAIAKAEREVIVETFILFDDPVGAELRAALIAAARRGVAVDLMVDGYGSPDLGTNFVGGLIEAGVRVRIFDPGRRWFGTRLNIWRRMHRKIVVVDGRLGYVGGLNYSYDHLQASGDDAKQDYAVELEGPVVADIHRFARDAIAANDHARHRRRRGAADDDAGGRAGGAGVLFVTRDNTWHTTDIESHYLRAIRTAQKRIVIANAYFFPGYRIIRALRRAARRGVDVLLILQGRPDLAWVRRPDLLQTLPADERKEWAAFWTDVGATIHRAANHR